MHFCECISALMHLTKKMMITNRTIFIILRCPGGVEDGCALGLAGFSHLRWRLLLFGRRLAAGARRARQRWRRRLAREAHAPQALMIYRLIRFIDFIEKFFTIVL